MQQDGRCPLCAGGLLLADDPPQSAREWEHRLATTRKTIAKEQILAREDAPDENTPRLAHTGCHHRHLAAVAEGPATSVRGREPDDPVGRHSDCPPARVPGRSRLDEPTRL
jgi:hypothetical protein